MKTILMTLPAGEEFYKLQQWNNLRNALVAANVDVVVLPEIEHGEFTASAGLLFYNAFIAGHRRDGNRAVEEEFENYFSDHSFNVRGGRFDPSRSFDMLFAGARDAIISHDRKHLWLGFGFETSYSYKARLDLYFDSVESIIVRPLWLRSAKFRSLDQCFCPLDTGDLLWYPDAFDDHSQMIIESWYKNRIDVSENDALRGCCNAISIDDKIIIPQCSVSLSTSLRSRGYSVNQLNMDRFSNTCKSLTLELIK